MTTKIKINKNDYIYLKEKGLLEEIKNPYDDFKYIFSLTTNKNKYYFKEESIDNIIKELIVIEIFKLFNIEAVEQEKATFETEETKYNGLLSKDFKEKNYDYIFLEEILNDYYVYIFNNDENDEGLMNYNLNNLEIIWNALEYRYKDYPDYENQVKIFMNELIKRFLVDILTGQIDRHALNILIKENEKEFSLAKVYDNSFSFDYTRLLLGVTPESLDYRNNKFVLTLSEFLNISSYKYTLQFKEMLDTLTIDKLIEIVNKIKNNNNLEDKCYNEIIDNYSKYYNKYTKVLKKRLR